MSMPAETITRSVDGSFAHKKIFPATDTHPLRGEFAMVFLRLEPLPHGSGLKLEHALFGQVSKEFIRGAETGIREAAQQGVVAGGPVTDLCVTLTELRYHEVDSSEQAFALAARGAFLHSLQKAGPKLVE